MSQAMRQPYGDDMNWLDKFFPDDISITAFVIKTGVLGSALGLGVIALILLSGCAPVAKFTYGDASNAAAIDPPGAPCYLGIGAAAQTVGEATGDVGVLTGIATERALSGALQSPACYPIEAALLGKLLKFTPAAPFVP